LPILGPQVQLALGKLARDRVALDPPAAAQSNSHRLMERELVRVAIHRFEPTAGFARRNVPRDEQCPLLGRESDLPCLWEAFGR
jgi:hypothetical protein